MFNTLSDAVKQLGEVKVLNMVNAQQKNIAYRTKRNLRIKGEERENHAIIAKAKSDPRFKDLFSAAKKVG